MGSGSSFVTIEGIDGSGKSMQQRLLVEYLRTCGHRTVSTYEPGGTPLGVKLRQVLLDPHGTALSPAAEALLFAAARAQHVHELIARAVADGQVVVCERFVDSSLAYQGYGEGLDLDWLRRVNAGATGGLKPGLTILLDVDPLESFRPEICGATAGEPLAAREAAVAAPSGGAGADRIESRGLEFFRRVRRGYLELARREPDRFRIIAARGDPLDIHERVRRAVVECLPAMPVEAAAPGAGGRVRR
jgi:dTMP kinase